MAGTAARALGRVAFAVQGRAERVGQRNAQQSGLAGQPDYSQRGNARAERAHPMRVVQVRRVFKCPGLS